MQEIEICPYEQVVYAKPRIRPGEWDTQSSLGFWYINGSRDLVQITRQDSQKKKKKKRTCWIVDFAVPVVQKSKIKRKQQKEIYTETSLEN